MHWSPSIIPLATKTPPAVRVRFSTTRRVTPTLPAECARSIRTRRASITLPAGSGRFSLTIRANYNTASGVNALWANSTGYSNTASGYEALYFNNGNENTASGTSALYYNTTGYSNTASGARALPEQRASTTRQRFMPNHGNTVGQCTLGDSPSTPPAYYALYSNSIAPRSDTGPAPTSPPEATTSTSEIQECAGESNTIRIGLTGMHTDDLHRRHLRQRRHEWYAPYM